MLTPIQLGRGQKKDLSNMRIHKLFARQYFMYDAKTKLKQIIM